MAMMMNHLSSIIFKAHHAALVCCTVLIIIMSLAAPSFSTADASSSSAALQQTTSPSRIHNHQLPTQSEFVSALLHQHYNKHRHRNLNQELRQQQDQSSTKFASLNEVLSTIELNLPDANVQQDVLGSTLDLTITNIVCRDLNVQDIQLTHDEIPEDDTLQRVEVDVLGVYLSCTFRWEYTYPNPIPFLGDLSGSGSGEAWLSEQDRTSSISVDIDFISKDYKLYPPHDVEMSDCDTNLQIEDMTFQDDGVTGINGFIVNALESLLRGTIEDELGEVVCDEIVELGEEGGAFDDMLSMVSDRIDTYLGVENDTLLLESNDPLSAEKNATVPKDEEGNPLWINFISVQDWIQELIGQDLNSLFDSLMGDEGENGMAINTFVRNSILDEDGLLVIDPTTILGDEEEDTTFLELHDMFTQTTMSIQSISIKGLDSFQEMRILDPIGNYTLQNTFKLEYLTFILEMEADIRPSSKSDAYISSPNDTDVPSIQETFNVEINATDVDVRFSLFLGLNNQTLGNMPLGSIIFLENILPCALSIVDAAEVTELVVSVDNVTSPTLSGFLDAGTDHLITTGADALYNMYEQVLLRAIPNFFASSIRDLLNEYIEDGLNDEDACPKPDSTLDGLVDYRDLFLPEEEAVEMQGRGGSPYGELFRGLHGFMDEIFSSVDENGLSWLNSVMVALLGLETNEKGDIILAGDLVSESLDISLNGLNAAIEIQVSDVTISNLDSLGALQLLQPMYGEQSVLNNSASMGVGPEPLRLSATILIKGKGDKLEVNNLVELSINLQDLAMILEILAQMEEPPFLNFPLQDISELSCWMYTMVTPVLDKYGIRVGETDTGLVLRNLSMAVAEARLNMNCISCSSPVMLELEEAMQTEEGIAETTDAANRIFEYATSLLGGEYVQSEIDKLLNEAAFSCPHSPDYQPNFQGIEYEELQPVETNEGSNGFLIAIIVVAAVVAVSSILIFFIARWLSRRRHNRWLKTLNKDQVRDLEIMELEEKDMTNDLNKRMSSLITSTDVPCLVRIITPIVIFGNIALFLSGHLSLGGTVEISGSIGEEVFNVEGFFEFSMAKSTIEMWEAGAKALAILIVLFSGVWPYSKLLFTLFIWVAPTTWLSFKRRGKILHWLDVLGKWSMVDVFVLLMTMASFRISVESPELSFLPENLYSIQLLVVPMWGLYANMIAQLVAQVSSHVIIHYHRKTVRCAAKTQEIELNLDPLPDSGDAREKLCTHSFKLDYEASSKRAIVRRGVSWVFLATLLSFTALVICGCSLPSFSVDTLGIVGLAVESGNRWEQAKTYYSVFDLATMMMDQARYINEASDYIGLGTLASLLVITVFIVPLAQAASLLAQWYAPMTKKQRSRNTVVNEIFSAWQYMEVYVLAIIIAAWQLGDVSEFMLNDYCDELEETFANLAYFGILDKEDAQCFRVNATVETASWLLVAASLVLCLMNHFIGSASLQKKKDDNTPAERRRHTDVWMGNTRPAQSAPEQAQSLPAVDGVRTMEEDEEKDTGTQTDDVNTISLSPIPPRFTDYYKFATTHRTEDMIVDDEVGTSAVETAVLPQNVENNEDMHHVVVH